MTPKRFNELARQLFGNVLEPHGFSSSESKRCTFYRKSDDLYRFVIPDISRSGSWYDIKVFVSSPLIDPCFESRFPDDLGIPFDVHSYLNPVAGVGMRQKQFGCETDQAMQASFDSLVKKALVEIAIPFLSQFRRIEDALPYLKTKLHRGTALLKVGRREEGKEILAKERERLLTAESSDPVVQTWLKFIDVQLA